MASSIQIETYCDEEESISFRKPKCIGGLSLDKCRGFHHDKRNFKYINVKLLKEKQISMDLDKGMETVIRKDMTYVQQEKLDALLKWILYNKFKFETPDCNKTGFISLSTDFICYRGLLTQLMCTPYEWKENWIIHAVKHKGTIYLLNIETSQKIRDRERRTEQDDRMCSWGYKFEQYMTFEDIEKPVDENEEFSCVLRSRLDHHSLVYGAEVDGADQTLYKEPYNNLDAFVELKTSNPPSNRRQEENFHKFKMKKWFCQSHLAGVPKLICGFKDGQYVTRLESFMVEEMPHKCRRYWDPRVMFKFVDQFFTWLKILVVEEHPKVYVFRSNQASMSVSGGLSPDATTFLPPWYTNELFSST